MDDTRLHFGASIDLSDIEGQTDELFSALESDAVKIGNVLNSALGDSFDEATKSLQNQAKVMSSLFEQIIQGTGDMGDSVEQKVSTLTERIRTTEQAISRYGDSLKEMQEKAVEAFNTGDYDTFSSLTDGIDTTQQKIAGLTEQMSVYKDMLAFVEQTNSMMSSDEGSASAPRFFASQEDYDAAEALRAKVAELQAELLNFNGTPEGLQELQSNLQDATTQLTALDNEAMQAASNLGSSLGGQASAISEQFYQVNNAVAAQRQVIADLEAELSAATATLDDMTSSEGENQAGIEAQVFQIDALTSRLQNAQAELYNLVAAQTDLDKQYKQTTQAVKDYRQAQEQADSTIVKMLGGAENYATILQNLPAPLQGAIRGIQGMTKAGLSFIKTPLGAVLGALVLSLQAVKKWFTASAEGQRKFAEISGRAKGVIDQLGEVVLRVGKSIYNFFSNIGENAKKAWEAVKQNFVNHFVGFFNIIPSLGKMLQDVFTGNWDGLGDSFKEFRNNVEKAVTGVDNLEDKIGSAADKTRDWAKSVADASKTQADINRERFDLDKEYSDWSVTKSEQNIRKQELRSAMYDTSKTKEERKKALDEYKAIIAEQMKMEEDFADRRIKLQEKEMALTTNPIEAEKELNALRKAKNDTIASLQGELAMLARRGNSIENGRGGASDLIKEEIKKNEEEIRKIVEGATQAVTEAELDSMDEGLPKVLAKIRTDYEKQKEEIEKQRAELETLYKSQNAIEGKGGELTADQQKELENFDKLLLLMQAKFNKATEDAEKQTARATEKALDDFLTAYGDKTTQAEAIEKRYNDALLTLAANSMNLTEEQYREILAKIEKEHKDALADLDLSGSDAYDKIFGDPGRMTKNALVEALDLAKKKLEELKNSGASTDTLAPLYEQIDKIRNEIDEFDTKDITSDMMSFAKQVVLLLKMREELNKTEKGSEGYKTLAANIERLEGSVKKSSVAVGINAFATALGNASGMMKEFADAVGDSGLAQQAEVLSITGDAISNALSAGLTSGNVLVGVASGLMSVMGSLIQKWKESRLEAIEAEKAAKDYAETLKMLDLNVDADAFKNIFGTDSFGLAVAQMEKARKAASKLKSDLASATVELNKMFKGAGENFTNYVNDQMMQALSDEKGMFDVDKARAFLDANKDISEELRKQIELAIESKEKYDDLMSSVDSYLEGLVGNMSSTMADAVFDAVVSGADAWEVWKEAGSEAILAIGKQMIAQMAMEQYLNQYKDALYEAISNGDENNLVGIITQMYTGAEQILGTLQTAAQTYLGAAEDAGLSFSGMREAATGGIQSMSQDSADELNGRFAVIQTHTYEINATTKAIQEQNAALVSNTSLLLAEMQGVHRDTTDIAEAIGDVKQSVAAMDKKMGTIIDTGVRAL